MNQSSILEETSITSVLYQRAKAVYKLRKLFNRLKLRTYFNTFVIKAFGSSEKTIGKYLFNENAIRLLKLRKILMKKSKIINGYLFGMLVKNVKEK